MSPEAFDRTVAQLREPILAMFGDWKNSDKIHLMGELPSTIIRNRKELRSQYLLWAPYEWPDRSRHNADDITEDDIPRIVLWMACRADPTRNKIYARWMVRLWTKGKTLSPLLEDFSTLGQVCDEHHARKRVLPLEKREINVFKSEQEVWTLIESVERPVSKRTKARDFEGEFFKNGGAKLVHDDDRIKVVVPLTEEASCFFGRNTRWCTASTASLNYFNDYNRRGELYIILLKETNERWQLQCSTGEFRYHDDTWVQPDHIDRMALDKVFHLKDLIKTYPSLIQFWPDIGARIRKAALKAMPTLAARIPNATEKELEAAIDEQPDLAFKLPDFSRSLALRALALDGHLIRHLTVDQRDDELVLAAMRTFPRAIAMLKDARAHNLDPWVVAETILLNERRFGGSHEEYFVDHTDIFMGHRQGPPNDPIYQLDLIYIIPIEIMTPKMISRLMPKSLSSEDFVKGQCAAYLSPQRLFNLDQNGLYAYGLEDHRRRNRDLRRNLNRVPPEYIHNCLKIFERLLYAAVDLEKKQNEYSRLEDQIIRGDRSDHYWVQEYEYPEYQHTRSQTKSLERFFREAYRIAESVAYEDERRFLPRFELIA